MESVKNLLISILKTIVETHAETHHIIRYMDVLWTYTTPFVKPNNSITILELRIYKI